MALFGSSEEKAEKASKKVQTFLSSKGLSDLSPGSYKQVENIMTDLAGNGLFKAGMALSFAKAEEQAKVTYLSALVEQNWILIKQQDDILKELKRLNSK
jgi:hypothetical protein